MLCSPLLFVSVNLVTQVNGDLTWKLYRAESLMRPGSRTAHSCLRAAKLLDELIVVQDEWKYHLLCAEALNALMRIQTVGNTITIDGPVDTPQHKQIWSTYGKTALQHARVAFDVNPNDARCAACYSDAFMFEGSSKGLIQQALTGAGRKFRENAQRLIDLDPAFDAGLGFTLMGCFYHVCPWPLANPVKARHFLQEACSVCPNSRRNHYHYAVVCYCQGDLATAKREFELSLRCIPRGNEADFGEFMAQKAQEALKLIRAKTP